MLGGRWKAGSGGVDIIDRLECGRKGIATGVKKATTFFAGFYAWIALWSVLVFAKPFRNEIRAYICAWSCIYSGLTQLIPRSKVCVPFLVCTLQANCSGRIKTLSKLLSAS